MSDYECIPCPFCGHYPIIELVGDLWMPFCSNIKCIAGNDGAWAKNEEMAASIWNTRIDKSNP